MEKKKTKWQLFVILGLACGVLGIAGSHQWLGLSEGLILLAVPGLLFLIIGLILLLIQSGRDKKAAKAEAEAKAAADAEAFRAEVAREAAEAKKSLTIECSLAGVTFKNDDGSSRQKILAEVEDKSVPVTLEAYKYEGNDAVRVLLDGDCVGNVPAKLVKKVISILDQVTEAWISVEGFIPEDGNSRKEIYRADLAIRYPNPSYDPSAE